MTNRTTRPGGRGERAWPTGAPDLVVDARNGGQPPAAGDAPPGVIAGGIAGGRQMAVGGFVAGGLLAATLPPWGWWFLGPVGAALLFTVLRGQPASRRIVCGLAAGAGLYLPGLFWITEFTIPGYAVVVVLEAAIFTVAIAAIPPGARAQIAGFPAALVLAEAARGAWPLGGLPLGGIDLGQAGGPLAPTARIGGHLLLVGLVGLAGVGLAGLAWLAAGALRRPRQTAVAGILSPSLTLSAALMGVVVAAVAVAAALPHGTPVGRITVAAVQGGGQRGLRAVDSDTASVFAAHLDAARAGVHPPVDLVLWPEDVIDIDRALAGSPQDAAVAGLARDLRATVVAGVVEDAGRRRFRNAAVAWGPDGNQVARYDKVHRVPFGEYVPARGLLDRLADLSDVPRDAIAGTGPGRLRTPAGTLGVLVSYEVFFAERARTAVDAGAGIILVPTNASSYRRSQVPGQELAAARLRAIETGRWVVQAAPTGYSAVIDDRGRVKLRTELGHRVVLQRHVTVRAGRTLATRLGDAPVIAGAAFAVAAGWALAMRDRRHRRSPV